MIKFGTGGWRAIIGDDFTKQNIQTLRAKGYEKIRTGRYARELSSFLPERSALRAEKQLQEVFEKLSEQERDLLV